VNNSLNALIIPASLAYPVHIKCVELDITVRLRVLQGGIGFISAVDWCAYLDNGGIRSAENVRAEVLIREAGVEIEETIHGTATFLGHLSPGEESDPPRHLIRLAEQLFDMPLAA
jgi:hypothetical protein